MYLLKKAVVSGCAYPPVSNEIGTSYAVREILGAADEEARAAQTAAQQAARVAARLAVAGGTSTSGAGGSGTEALGSAMNLDVDIAAVSAVASSLRYSHIPDEKKAASERARREAARLTGGGTSASGGGGGGVSTNDILLNGEK